MAKVKVAETVERLARPLAEQAGCTLWDVEYVREGGEWFVRVAIDREGGVSLDDCEAVSRPLSDALDVADPIPGSYTLEVTSAGLDRALRKPEHFAHCRGARVDVRLYRAAEDGQKRFTGVLEDFSGDAVTVGGRTFPLRDVAQVRLHVEF